MGTLLTNEAPGKPGPDRAVCAAAYLGLSRLEPFSNHSELVNQ